MGSHPRKYSLEPREVPRVETPNRRIVTRLPVPASLPILEALERFEPSSMQGQPPLVIDRAGGWSVHDRWGNTWLDWSSGVLISNVGNSNPAVVAALREMLDRPLLSTYVFAHEKRAELVELLAGLAPSADYKVFLLTTGSEATENCIKLARTWGRARHGPDRRVLVSFDNAFHGRTMGAQLAGGIPGQKAWLGRLDDSFVQVPFPDGYANPDLRFELFLETLQRKGVEPSRVCGVMTESFQGVGPDFFPVEYARRLESWCRENDALLIVDEVQAGFCRDRKVVCLRALWHHSRPYRVRQGDFRLAPPCGGDRPRGCPGAVPARIHDLDPLRLPASGGRSRRERKDPETGEIPPERR